MRRKRILMAFFAMITIVSVAATYSNVDIRPGVRSRLELPYRSRKSDTRTEASSQNAKLKPPKNNWLDMAQLNSRLYSHVNQFAPRTIQGFISGLDIAKFHLHKSLYHVNQQRLNVIRSLKLMSSTQVQNFGSGAVKLNPFSDSTLKEIEELNDDALKYVLDVINSTGWEYVTEKHGVTVSKKYLNSGKLSSNQDSASVVDEKAAAKFACVMAKGTISAPASEVYSLFLSNDRVHEYNENCADVRDLEKVSPSIKITWARSPRMGPFKPRDFVTVVNYRTLEDGTLAVINRPVEHPSAPSSNQYVRAEILIATNMMIPNKNDPLKTDFISVTHINPGGVVDSLIGAQIMNALCAQAPVKLIQGLEKAAKKTIST